VGEVKTREFPAAEHTFKASGRRFVKREESAFSEGEIPPHWQRIDHPGGRPGAPPIFKGR